MSIEKRIAHLADVLAIGQKEGSVNIQWIRREVFDLRNIDTSYFPVDIQIVHRLIVLAYLA